MAIGAAIANFGIPIALQMGHGWLQSRDIKKAQKKAEKENKRAQAMSNLINALSPSARHQAYRTEAEYRPSGLTRALGAAKLGYGAYTGLKDAIAKEAAQKGAQELQDMAIDAARREALIAGGEDLAARLITEARSQGLEPGTSAWWEHMEKARKGSDYKDMGGGFDSGVRETLEGHIGAYLDREKKKGLTGGAGQLTQPKEVREQFKAIGIFEDKIVNLQRLLKDNADVLGHAPGGFESLKRLWQYDEKGRRRLRKPEGFMKLLQSAMPDALVDEPPYALDVEKRLGLVTQGFEDLASAWRNARETGVMTEGDFARAMRQVGGADVSYDQSSSLLDKLSVGVGIEKSNLEKLYGPSPLDLEPPSLGVGAGKAAVVAGAQGGEEGPAWWEAPRMPSEVVDTATSNITQGLDQQGAQSSYLLKDLEAEAARRQKSKTSSGKLVVEDIPDVSGNITRGFDQPPLQGAPHEPYQGSFFHEGPDIKIVPSPNDGHQGHPLNTKEAQAISGVGGAIGRHLMEGVEHKADLARDLYTDLSWPVKSKTWSNESRRSAYPHEMKGTTGTSIPPISLSPSEEASRRAETFGYLRGGKDRPSAIRGNLFGDWGLSEEKKERRRKLGLYGGSSYYE